VQAGESYRFSAFFRSEGAVRAQAVLAAKQADGSYQELSSVELDKPLDRWARVSGTLKAKGTSDRAMFQIRVQGEGSLWVDKVSLMPEQNRLGWRTDVVDAIKQSRPAIVRWGGCIVDPGAYRWKDGIGDRDLRVPFRNTFWGRVDSNDVGINEFCQFCELVGAEPLVCVSFSDGAPRRASPSARAEARRSATSLGS